MFCLHLCMYVTLQSWSSLDGGIPHSAFLLKISSWLIKGVFFLPSGRLASGECDKYMACLAPIEFNTCGNEDGLHGCALLDGCPCGRQSTDTRMNESTPCWDTYRAARDQWSYTYHGLRGHMLRRDSSFWGRRRRYFGFWCLVDDLEEPRRVVVAMNEKSCLREMRCSNA